MSLSTERKWCLRRGGGGFRTKSLRRWRGMDVKVISLTSREDRERGWVRSPVNHTFFSHCSNFSLEYEARSSWEDLGSRYGRFQEPGETQEGCSESGRVNIAGKESRIA